MIKSLIVQCLLIYNLETDKIEKISEEKNCQVLYPAASTFKVPLAVMAFDSGVLKDENQLVKWDGKKRWLESWNHDHNAKTWMRDSVVWFSQWITPKMGEKKLQKYLNYFDYGNKDLTSGITDSWLSPSPNNPERPANSLKVSGMGQLDFLKKLHRLELPASKSSQEITKTLLVNEIGPNGTQLMGKTGSGYQGKNHELRVGWFVGYFLKEKTHYVVVSNFVDKEKNTKDQRFGGMVAKESLREYLREQKYW